MTKEKGNTFQNVLFLFIILISICILFQPNRIIGVDFFQLLLIISIIYLVIFKRLYLIKNSFLLGNNKGKIIVGSAFFIVPMLISFSIKTGGFEPITRISEDAVYTLFQTFTEELVFRVAILGLAIEGFYLKQFKGTFFYWTDGKKNGVILFLIMLAISVLFSNLHKDWLITSNLLVLRSLHGFIYTAAFVLTNKKIYAPWILHYVNNMFYAFY